MHLIKLFENRLTAIYLNFRNTFFSIDIFNKKVHIFPSFYFLYYHFRLFPPLLVFFGSFSDIFVFYHFFRYFCLFPLFTYFPFFFPHFFHFPAFSHFTTFPFFYLRDPSVCKLFLSPPYYSSVLLSDFVEAIAVLLAEEEIKL